VSFLALYLVSASAIRLLALTSFPSSYEFTLRLMKSANSTSFAALYPLNRLIRRSLEVSLQAERLWT
jgi:hypothetical protein